MCPVVAGQEAAAQQEAHFAARKAAWEAKKQGKGLSFAIVGNSPFSPSHEAV
jgi:hypothetical protein